MKKKGKNWSIICDYSSMDIQIHILQKKELYEVFLAFIDDDFNSDIFNKLIKAIKSQKIPEDIEELCGFLQLIAKIEKNHHRDAQFFIKIEKILLYFEENIKLNLSSTEIFQIFKKSKRILLFLFKKQIIKINKFILNEIKTNCVELEINKQVDLTNLINNSNYQCYFYPEIKMHIKEEECKIIEDKLHSQIGPNFLNDFDEKREIGENDSYICQLIRQDFVEDFISYINRRNISLLSKIPNSIFETNRLFLKKNPTLIEYAAFYGSIQIFQYLQFNKVELESSLWIYVIHSKKPELIHLLEENHIDSTDFFYEECLHEAIKCHHNEIAQYIIDNLSDESYENRLIQRNFFKNILSYSFHYCNYSFIPIDFNNKFIFYYLCKYNYIKLVKLFLNNNKVDLNLSIIHTYEYV